MPLAPTAAYFPVAAAATQQQQQQERQEHPEVFRERGSVWLEGGCGDTSPHPSQLYGIASTPCFSFGRDFRSIESPDGYASQSPIKAASCPTSASTTASSSSSLSSLQSLPVRRVDVQSLTSGPIQSEPNCDESIGYFHLPPENSCSSKDSRCSDYSCTPSSAAAPPINPTNGDVPMKPEVRHRSLLGPIDACYIASPQCAVATRKCSGSLSSLSPCQQFVPLLPQDTCSSSARCLNTMPVNSMPVVSADGSTTVQQTTPVKTEQVEICGVTSVAYPLTSECNIPERSEHKALAKDVTTPLCGFTRPVNGMRRGSLGGPEDCLDVNGSVSLPLLRDTISEDFLEEWERERSDAAASGASVDFRNGELCTTSVRGCSGVGSLLLQLPTNFICESSLLSGAPSPFNSSPFVSSRSSSCCSGSAQLSAVVSCEQQDNGGGRFGCSSFLLDDDTTGLYGTSRLSPESLSNIHQFAEEALQDRSSSARTNSTINNMAIPDTDAKGWSDISGGSCSAASQEQSHSERRYQREHEDQIQRSEQQQRCDGIEFSIHQQQQQQQQAASHHSELYAQPTANSVACSTTSVLRGAPCPPATACSSPLTPPVIDLKGCSMLLPSDDATAAVAAVSATHSPGVSCISGYDVPTPGCSEDRLYPTWATTTTSTSALTNVDPAMCVSSSPLHSEGSQGRRTSEATNGAGDSDDDELSPAVSVDRSSASLSHPASEGMAVGSADYSAYTKEDSPDNFVLLRQQLQRRQRGRPKKRSAASQLSKQQTRRKQIQQQQLHEQHQQVYQHLQQQQQHRSPTLQDTVKRESQWGDTFSFDLSPGAPTAASLTPNRRGNNCMDQGRIVDGSNAVAESCKNEMNGCSPINTTGHSNEIRLPGECDSTANSAHWSVGTVAPQHQQQQQQQQEVPQQLPQYQQPYSPSVIVQRSAACQQLFPPGTPSVTGPLAPVSAAASAAASPVSGVLSTPENCSMYGILPPPPYINNLNSSPTSGINCNTCCVDARYSVCQDNIHHSKNCSELMDNSGGINKEMNLLRALAPTGTDTGDAHLSHTLTRNGTTVGLGKGGAGQTGCMNTNISGASYGDGVEDTHILHRAQLEHQQNQNMSQQDLNLQQAHSYPVSLTRQQNGSHGALQQQVRRSQQLPDTDFEQKHQRQPNQLQEQEQQQQQQQQRHQQHQSQLQQHQQQQHQRQHQEQHQHQQQSPRQQQQQPQQLGQLQQQGHEQEEQQSQGQHFQQLQDMQEHPQQQTDDDSVNPSCLDGCLSLLDISDESWKHYRDRGMFKLGDKGRAVIKSRISRQLRLVPVLRKRAATVAGVRCATTKQLFQLAQICGLFDVLPVQFQPASFRSSQHQQQQQQHLTETVVHSTVITAPEYPSSDSVNSSCAVTRLSLKAGRSSTSAGAGCGVAGYNCGASVSEVSSNQNSKLPLSACTRSTRSSSAIWSNTQQYEQGHQQQHSKCRGLQHQPQQHQEFVHPVNHDPLDHGDSHQHLQQQQSLAQQVPGMLQQAQMTQSQQCPSVVPSIDMHHSLGDCTAVPYCISNAYSMS